MNSNNDSIILMVEDEEGVMDVNKRMLKRRGFDLQEAKNAAEAYAFLEETIPDLIILDIMLPDGNGYDICRDFRKKSNNPVVFLTGKDEVRDKVKGLSLGCDYYLTKPYNFDELLAVVTRLLERKTIEKKKKAEEKIMTIGKLTLDYHKAAAFLDGRNVELTKKELRLLETFMENKNQELSTDVLYEAVWGEPPLGEAQDVRNLRKHLMNLRHKIQADDSNEYDILTTYGKGYTFVVF